MSEYDGMPLDVVAGRLTVEYWTDDNGNPGKPLTRGEWPNPPIIEKLENEPEFTEADLLRLAGQLEAAIEQGWVFKRYLPCGDREHRHSWRFTAWLCRLVIGG